MIDDIHLIYYLLTYSFYFIYNYWPSILSKNDIMGNFVKFELINYVFLIWLL